MLTATRDFVRSHQQPLLVLPDNTNRPHPYETAMEMARLAPNAEVVSPWKDSEDNVAFAVRHIRTFLRAYAPR